MDENKERKENHDYDETLQGRSHSHPRCLCLGCLYRLQGLFDFRVLRIQ